MTDIVAPQAGSIRTDIDRPDTALVERARAFPSATLHEAAGKTGALPSAIKPVAVGMRITGPAVTVQSPPGDNLWLHRGLYAARPGDVLVVNVSGHYEAGYFGELMAHSAVAHKLGGLVIDGCVRDGDLLAEIGFPVFARGLCIRGTGKDHRARGSVNHAVVIGDVTVAPGDLVVGDGDGVVALAAQNLAATLDASAAREAKEVDTIEKLRAGVRSLDLYGWK